MLESENTPPGEDQAAPPNPGEDQGKPTSRNDKLDEVARLLAGEDQDDDQAGDDQDAAEKPPGEDQQNDGKLETLEDLAKALDLDASALYEIAITQPGNGEDQVTIGELADLAKDRGQFELDRLEFEDSRQKRETALVRAQAEIGELLKLLPDRAKSPELLELVAGRMAKAQESERVHTLQAIPEWNDEKVEAQEREAISKSLSEYGFSAGYLDTVHDHRTLKYIRDNWQRQQRMEKALAAMRKKPARSQRPGKPGQGKASTETPTPTRRTAGPRGQAAKAAAVAELLKG